MSIQNKENQENTYIFNKHLNHLFDISDDEVYETRRSFYKNLENNYKKDNSKKSGGENA